MGKEYLARVAALTNHLGGSEALSVPQRTLVDRAARLGLIVETSWHELADHGVFRNGEPVPALAAFRSALADEREVLRILGIERRERVVRSLSDVLAGKEQS
jgi:hypothetical protein